MAPRELVQAMYFPKGFSRPKAVQLADLVIQAYEQLAAFQNDRPWNLRGPYALITELRLAGGPGTSRLRLSHFYREIPLVARSRKRPEKQLPIGFVARKGTEVFLVFRGTMTTLEWLRDLRIRLTDYPYLACGKVHDGFVAVYEGLRRSIMDALAAAGGKGKLYVAGHSLGAALATLALPDIVSRTAYDEPIAYTYGSPRVGDNGFAEHFNSMMAHRSFRIANTSDLVVSVPFSAPFLGFLGGYFTHVDTPVDFTVQKENAEDNHHINTYRAALAGARPKSLLGSLLK